MLRDIGDRRRNTQAARTPGGAGTHTYIQVPSGTTVAYKWFPDWTHYTEATSKQRPSWRVLSLDGQVNVAGTYAYCYGQ